MEKDLINLVKNAGIVGAGGAGFPTHVKINAKAEYVIVNCAECEPLIRVDQQLMAIYTDKILKGLSLIMEQTGAKFGFVALKEKYHDAINSLNESLKEYNNISIHILDNFYPAGDEQVLVYEVTGRIVPEGGIPLNVGVVVSNVETVLNIYKAYYDELPVTEKYLTVTGDVKNKITLKVPVGIKVKEAINFAGGTSLNDYVIINGGPMMGKIVDDESFVTKTTKALIVLPKDHKLVSDLTKNLSQMLREAKTSCLSCRHCSEVCPRGLLGHRIEPDKIMRIASYGSVCDDNYTPMAAYLCCGCRLCEYECIMNLQPWKLNGSLKMAMKKSGIKNSMNNTPSKAYPYREYKRFPIKKLIARLGLLRYDEPAPMIEIDENKINEVTILLSQHTGAPAVPVIKTGDIVNKGDMIGEIPEGKLGSRVHASISGKVTHIDSKSVTIKAL